jgi:hypothetical protein
MAGTDVTPYLAEMRRLSQERDTAERRLRRIRYGVEEALKIISARPEREPEPESESESALTLRRTIEGLAAIRAAS